MHIWYAKSDFGSKYLCTRKKYRIDDVSSLFFVATFASKKNHEISNALHYKPLFNINRSEKWGKKIQAGGYNGARTVTDLPFFFFNQINSMN